MATDAEIVRKLELEYVPMFEAMGMSPDEAREAFGALVENAKEASRSKHLGDVDATRLTNLAQTDPNIRMQIDWRTKEGVREEDFQWWWNMPDLERQILLQVDDTHRIGYYEALRRSGVPKDEALQRVRSTSALYVEFLGENEDPNDVHGPLPVELRARVIQFIEGEAALDPSGALWREKVSRAGSFNAAIRREIRESNV